MIRLLGWGGLGGCEKTVSMTAGDDQKICVMCIVTVKTNQQLLILSFLVMHFTNIDRFPLFSAVNIDCGNTTLAINCNPNN